MPLTARILTGCEVTVARGLVAVGVLTAVSSADATIVGASVREPQSRIQNSCKIDATNYRKPGVPHRRLQLAHPDVLIRRTSRLAPVDVVFHAW
jgi:hypothetical protein